MNPEFIINEHLKVALIEGKSVILVDNEPFDQCSYILLVNPQNNPKQHEINSIDEAKQVLNSDLEEKIRPKQLGITLEQEFWAHCSNLQAWYEYNYDTRLLHSNLAFPLLKKLAKIGDLKANRVFKEEVAKRFSSGSLPTILFLLQNEYLETFTEEEFDSLIEQHSYEAIKQRNLTKLCTWCVALIYKSTEVLNWSNDLGKADGLFQEILSFKERGNDITPWKALGEAYRKAAKYGQAICALSQALCIEPENSVIWGELTLTYLKAEDASRAKNAILQAIRFDPNNNSFWGILGYIYLYCKNYEMALFGFLKAIYFDETCFFAWYDLAKLYEKMGRYSQAIYAYERCTTYNPQSLSSYISLVLMYMHTSQHSKALTAFKHVLEIEPDHIKALKMIKQALSNSLKTLLN